MANRSFTTFLLSGQLFGIDILMVREINKQLEITPVPHANEYIRGLLNLRGQIVTILDLNRRLGLEKSKLANDSHNIILKTEQELQAMGIHQAESGDYAATSDKVGLLVDDIRDVVIVPEQSIEPPPANMGKIDGQFLTGVIKQNNSLVAVLSVDKLLK